MNYDEEKTRDKKKKKSCRTAQRYLGRMSLEESIGPNSITSRDRALMKINEDYIKKLEKSELSDFVKSYYIEHPMEKHHNMMNLRAGSESSNDKTSMKGITQIYSNTGQSISNDSFNRYATEVTNFIEHNYQDDNHDYPTFSINDSILSRNNIPTTAITNNQGNSLDFNDHYGGAESRSDKRYQPYKLNCQTTSQSFNRNTMATATSSGLDSNHFDDYAGISKNRDNPMYSTNHNIDDPRSHYSSESDSINYSTISLLKNRVNILKSSFQNPSDLQGSPLGDAGIQEEIIMSNEKITEKPPPVASSNLLTADEKRRASNYHHSARFIKKFQNRDPKTLTSREKMLIRKHKFIVNKYEYMRSNPLPLSSEKNDHVTAQKNSHSNSPSELNYTASSTDDIIVISDDEDDLKVVSEDDMGMEEEISDLIPDETKSEKELAEYLNSLSYIRQLQRRNPKTLTPQETKCKKEYLSSIRKYQMKYAGSPIILNANINETDISKLVTTVVNSEGDTSNIKPLNLIVKLSLPPVNMDNRSILLLIKKQNESFCTADWKIVRECKSGTGDGKDIWISISSESLKLLRSTNGKIRFGIKHLQMILPQENENSTVSILESPNIVQHSLKKSPAVISNSNINKNKSRNLDDIKELSNDTSKTSSVSNVSHSEGQISTIESINFVVKLWLPPVNMDNRSILLLLKKQNESFCTADWKIVSECKSDTGDGKDIWISISSESLKLLRSTDGKIRFGIKHLQMILPQENDLESPNIVQHSLKSRAVISNLNINKNKIMKLDDNKKSSNDASKTSSVTNASHPEGNTSTTESINFEVKLSLPPVNVDNRSILLLLKQQNKSFSSGNWKIIRDCKSDTGGGKDFWISVSSESLKLLRNADGKIRFGINHVQMILPQENETSTVSNFENCSTVHSSLKNHAVISNSDINKTKIRKLSSNNPPEISACVSSVTNVAHPEGHSSINESLSFVVKVSIPPLEINNSTSILLLMKKQNESLCSANWKIIRERKSETGEGKDIWISVSSESLELIRKANGHIYFGIKRLQMILPQENSSMKSDVNREQIVAPPTFKNEDNLLNSNSNVLSSRPTKSKEGLQALARYKYAIRAQYRFSSRSDISDEELNREMEVIEEGRAHFSNKPKYASTTPGFFNCIEEAVIKSMEMKKK